MEDLACYRELWAKPADNIQDSYLYEFILKPADSFPTRDTSAIRQRSTPFLAGWEKWTSKDCSMP